MAKQFELATGADLVKYIGTIGRASAKLDKMIQHAAVHAIGHAVEFGDIKYANELLAVVPKGRKQGFVAFMEVNGPFAYSTTGKTFAYFKRATLEFDGAALIAGKQWHEFIKEQVASTLDVEEAVDKLLKRIEKAVKENPSLVKHMDMYSAISKASAEYHSAKVVEADDDDVALPVPKAA